MPKKALVLNGFGGGINQSSDASDLTSQGQGKDELVEAQGCLTDSMGKTKVYKTGTGTSPFSNDYGNIYAAGNTLVINDSKSGIRQGGYKIGDTVNWSDRYSLDPPTIDDLNGGAVADGIGLEAIPGLASDEVLYMGKGSNYLIGDNAIFGTQSSANIPIHNFLRSAVDGDNDNSYWESKTSFDDIDTSVGKYNRMLPVDNFDATAKDYFGWFINENPHTDALDPSGTYDASAGTVTMAHDGAFDPGPIAKYGTTYDGTNFTEITQYRTYKFGIFATDVNEWADYDITVRLQTAAYDYTTLCTISIDSEVGSEGKWYTAEYTHSAATITGKLVFWYGMTETNLGTADAVWHGVKAMYQEEGGVRVYETGNSNMELTSKTPIGENPFLSHQDSDDLGHYDLSGSSHLVIFKQLNNTANLGAVFRLGNSKAYSSNMSEGIMGYNFSSSGKDIYLEIEVNPGEGIPDGALTHMDVILDSHSVDYTISPDDAYGRAFTYTDGALKDAGCWGQRGLLKIPIDSYTTNGASFDVNDIKTLWIVFRCVTQGGFSWNVTVAKIYSVQFAESKNIGWSNKEVEFLQTDTRYNAETLPSTYSGTISFGSNNMLTAIIDKPTNSSYSGNLYYKTIDSDKEEHVPLTRFLLANIDYTDGVKVAGSDSYEPWDGSSYTFSFKSPPLSSTFEFESGYPEGTAHVDAAFQTATVVGRQVYIGNVTQNGVTNTSLILKAPPGKYYGFSDKSYIDLELGASTIKVLESAGDRLFVFSEDHLTIINVAQDYEFLEASIAGGGVLYPYQVVRVGEGLAFVNSEGISYFDGNQINNLSDNFIDSVSFSNDSRISYNPNHKMIMVWPTASSARTYNYSLKTGKWVGEINVPSGDEPGTNTVLYNGDAYIGLDTGSAFSIKKIVDMSSTVSLELKTGKISCGNMAMEKSFKKCYVTLNMPTSTTVNVAWDIDSGTHTGNTNITSNGVNEVDIGKNGKMIQLTLTDATAPVDLEISDIQLIYRDKRVK